MDTELLKTFLEVQKTRHFGKAAENLYLTQSAVSFRIRQLEQSLGVALFTRFRNNIQLTSAGELLLPHAQAVMQAMIAAKQQLALQSSRPRPSFWQIAMELAFLFERLPTFPLQHPQSLQVQYLSPTATIQQPLHATDGFIGFDNQIELAQSTVRFSLGFLKLNAYRADNAAEQEARWQIPSSVPPLSMLPPAFICNDVALVHRYMQLNSACGYLPECVADAQLERLTTAPLWLELFAYTASAADWPQSLAQLLHTAGLLQPRS